MLLAVDVGNTGTDMGIFRKEKLVARWSLSTDRNRSVDEYGITLRSLFATASLDVKEVEAVAVSCVVPPLESILAEMSRRYLSVEPLFVAPGIKTGMPILVDNPSEVGADRIVNGVAAFVRFQRAVIVADFGTATTFDAVSAKGEYLGGAIAPGLRISAQALFEAAAKLPRIDLKRPERAIGRSTVTSMQSGILLGYLGLVRGILDRMRLEMEGNPAVIATGGLAPLLEPDLSEWVDEVDPDLTLIGLRILHERNR
ncbi:MAG TPA: type III pantothenate kinase [Candidatus Polarisedimenticolia bacterium]|jgi:type III pantothenate kinase|nr:type III pantothenate kinase [Candidatus Polarisedimenticolia bacterium]